MNKRLIILIVWIIMFAGIMIFAFSYDTGKITKYNGINNITSDIKNESIKPLYDSDININISKNINNATEKIIINSNIINCAAKENEHKLECSSSFSQNIQTTVTPMITSTSEQEIPEFPTIVLPVAGIFALLYIFKFRKN